MPYLRIFDPREGSHEEELKKTRMVIGRQDDADIRLDHPTVSRLHSLLLKSGDGYVIDDYQSMAGTLVNNNRIDHATLNHGDSIQIGLFVLEFRTDDAVRRASLALGSDSGLMRRMRMQFRMLPAGITLRYRSLGVQSSDLFSPGDTLRVGGGGILVTSRQPPAEGSCIEVELTWPNGKAKTFLGEVLAVLEGEELPGMCVKLHSVEGQRHMNVVNDARRGSWQAPDRGRRG